MGEENGGKSGTAFLIGFSALLIFSCLGMTNNVMADRDPLRFVAGDRPIYQFYSGTNGSDEWLVWELPAGTGRVGVTYEKAGSAARDPAAFLLTGSMFRQGRDGRCQPRAEWDVSVAGASIASGILTLDHNRIDAKAQLPESAEGLRIDISVRRADSGNCAVTLSIDDLFISGDAPIPFVPTTSPKIFIVDACDDDEPCPPG